MQIISRDIHSQTNEDLNENKLEGLPRMERGAGNERGSLVGGLGKPSV